MLHSWKAVLVLAFCLLITQVQSHAQSHARGLGFDISGHTYSAATTKQTDVLEKNRVSDYTASVNQSAEQSGFSSDNQVVFKVQRFANSSSLDRFQLSITKKAKIDFDDMEHSEVQLASLAGLHRNALRYDREIEMSRLITLQLAYEKRGASDKQTILTFAKLDRPRDEFRDSLALSIGMSVRFRF